VANKQYRDARLQVRVSGLEPADYHLSTPTLSLGKVQRQSLVLSISPHLPHGLYAVRVEVESADGWTGRFAFQHFAG